MEPWSQPPIVSYEHLLGFGAVIHNYAMAETGLKISVACLLGIELVDLLILAEPYTSASLGNVARSLARSREPLSPASKSVISFADQLQAASGLRNSIAHDRWTTGERPDSIMACRLDIKRGRPIVKGIVGSDRDWTAAELYAQADTLAELNRNVTQFMVENDCRTMTGKPSALP